MKTNSYTKSKARVVNIQGISVSLNCINANAESDRDGAIAFMFKSQNGLPNES